MTPKQLSRHLDRAEHALADLPPETRRPIEQLLGKLHGAYLLLWLENRRLRQAGTSGGVRRLWSWLRRVNLS